MYKKCFFILHPSSFILTLIPNPQSLIPCFGELVDKNPMAHACLVFGFGHLEGHEPAVVAYDRVRRLVAGIIGEVSQPLNLAAAVEFQLPKIDVIRAFVVLLIAFHKRVLAVGKDAFGLVVLAGRVGVVHHFFGGKIDAANVGALVSVGGENQFLFLGRAEVLRFQRAFKGQIAAFDNDLLIGQFRRAVFVNDVGFLHPRFASRHLVRVLRRRRAPRRCASACAIRPVLRCTSSPAARAAWSGFCRARKANTARG